jgi:hypothetical protein
MGGGHRFHYPKWVWSPSGGWWPNPVNAKRNALIYSVFAGVTCFWLYQFGESKTVWINYDINILDLFARFEVFKTNYFRLISS